MNKLNNLRTMSSTALLVVAIGLFCLAIPGPPSSGAAQADHDSPFAQAHKLAGTWVRPDGGYRMVIEDVGPDGDLTVSYYNPRRINVHSAAWKLEDSKLHVLVELRDVNYPGSVYRLTYLKDYDLMVGMYYQALEKRTYEVGFLRIVEDL